MSNEAPPRGALSARLRAAARPPIAEPAAPPPDDMVAAAPAEGRCTLCDKPLAPQSAYLASTSRINTAQARPLCITCVAKVRDGIGNQTRAVDWKLGILFGLFATLLITAVFGLAEAQITVGPRGSGQHPHFYGYIALLPAFLLGRVVGYGMNNKRGWPVWVVGSLLLILSFIAVEYIVRSAEIADFANFVPQFRRDFAFMDIGQFWRLVGQHFDLLTLPGVVVGIAVLIVTTWPQRLYIRHLAPDA